MGPYDSLPSGARYIIVLMDYTSRWPELKLVRDPTYFTLIEFLREIFLREGFPESIISDNGTQFVSQEFTSYVKSCGIKHLKAPYIILKPMVWWKG